jgi:uncharacterized protein YqjF (DUF2071 family)
MKVQRIGNETFYQSQRLASSQSAAFSAHIRHGEQIRSQDVTPFQHYLTVRWSLFGVRGDRLTFARASHEPWPLREDQAITWSTTLHEPSKIPAPRGMPIVLSNPGVRVDIGARGYLT